MDSYTTEDQERDWIEHHKKVLRGDIKIDLRRSYYYDPSKRRKKTRDEVISESREFLRSRGIQEVD